MNIFSITLHIPSHEVSIPITIPFWISSYKRWEIVSSHSRTRLICKNFIIIYSIMMVAAWIVTIPYMIHMFMNAASMGDTAMPVFGPSFWVICLALSAVFGIATFCIMDHGMTKKLNLE